MRVASRQMRRSVRKIRVPAREKRLADGRKYGAARRRFHAGGTILGAEWRMALASIETHRHAVVMGRQGMRRRLDAAAFDLGRRAGRFDGVRSPLLSRRREDSRDSGRRAGVAHPTPLGSSVALSCESRPMTYEIS